MSKKKNSKADCGYDIYNSGGSIRNSERLHG